MKLYIGVAADDFTGASDAASFLREAGLSTVLLNGIPEEIPTFREDVHAVVIALKTRTMPREDAVSQMLRAFAVLKEMGAEKLYFKYCATFDSTEAGNIGPVCDAVLREYQIPYTVLCPALQVNGRTVKDRILYVNGIHLAESHMKDHPLTPMRESDLKPLMEMQSEFPAFAEGDEAAGGEHYYLIPDYEEDAQGDAIAERYGDLPFLTGGSGLAGALGRRAAKLHGIHSREPVLERKSGTGEIEASKAILLAGSCSKVTLTQIARYQQTGHPTLQILPEKLMNGMQTPGEIMNWVRETGSEGLVYSSQSPEEMEKNRHIDRELLAGRIEQTVSEVAARALSEGYTRIISAGGETSGAITKALGFASFYIGESVAPGVPVMIPTEKPQVRLVLKSGGFGQEDFFEKAVAATERSLEV